MEQRSLRVAETNKTFFSKLSSTLSKMIVPTRVGINGMMISIKRNALIKAYNNYAEMQKTNDTNKIEAASQKYEDSYSLYLEIIDKNIMDSVYKKVKNGIANEFEKNALSKYYLIVSLKNDHYLEYKYRKQEYLLKIDYETASNIKKENLLKNYKEFYVSKMNSLYKGLLKNYSVILADNVNTKIDNNEIYAKVFKTLQDFAEEMLPIRIETDQSDAKAKEAYEKYEATNVGKLDERDRLKQKIALLSISRQFFTHSLPLAATEKCYIKLIKEAREEILKSKNSIKKDLAYKTLIEIIEEYNLELLSTKVYWDNLQERAEYKKFWEKYNEIQKIENEEEKTRQKVVLFLKGDIKKLYKNESKYSQIIKEHKARLIALGGMRSIKGEANGYSGSKFSRDTRKSRVC